MRLRVTGGEYSKASAREDEHFSDTFIDIVIPELSDLIRGELRQSGLSNFVLDLALANTDLLKGGVCLNFDLLDELFNTVSTFVNHMGARKPSGGLR